MEQVSSWSEAEEGTVIQAGTVFAKFIQVLSESTFSQLNPVPDFDVLTQKAVLGTQSLLGSWVKAHEENDLDA